MVDFARQLEGGERELESESRGGGAERCRWAKRSALRSVDVHFLQAAVVVRTREEERKARDAALEQASC